MSRRGNAATHWSRQVEASCPRYPPWMPDRGKENMKEPPQEKGKQIDRLLLPLSLASSSAICAMCSSRSLFSHSEASMPASSLSASGGIAVLPTSVVEEA